MMLEKSRSHVAILSIGTILCAFSLASIIKFTDPYKVGAGAHALLYITLFLFGLGLFTTLGIVIRQRFSAGIYIVNVKVSTRQAFLLSALLTGSILLQGKNLLFWWVELLLILFIIVLEIFFNL